MTSWSRSAASGAGSARHVVPAGCRTLQPTWSTTSSRTSQVHQWVLSLPIPLRLLLAAQPELVTPLLQVVRRMLMAMSASDFKQRKPQW